MINHTLSILSDQIAQVRDLVFSIPGVEGAAFLLCSESRTGSERRFLCREVIPVPESAYLVREPDFLSLDSSAYVPIAKRARAENLSVIFVHSHPGGFLDYSDQDDREEPKLQEFLHARVPDKVHGSLVLTETGITGRVWIDGGFQHMNRVRVIGRRFEFHDRIPEGENESLPFFDRQVRAFGPAIQALLGWLHVGVVGAGGTGSAVVEQLTRLGVGKLSVFDGDVFDGTNVNRVFGSGTADTGQKKVDLASRNVNRIGLGTEVVVYPEHITKEEVARSLRDCDLVFGCTDKEAPRAILVQLALRYLIPVFDMGVLIDSTEGAIRDVVGRVTTLLPGEACLFCRGRISSDGVANESLSDEERAALAAEGYAPELPTPSPAVVAFTSAVASIAVSELLHRLTGFMGDERESSEVLLFFDKSRMRTNRALLGAECLCNQRQLWGRGDSRSFLGLTWAN